MLVSLLLAAATVAYTPAQLAEYRGKIKSSCEASLAGPGQGVPNGFCTCFSQSTAAEAMALTPQQRSVFLLLTENAGDPVAAQRAAQSRLNMTVETFASHWDKLNPIGQKAGTACAKGKGGN